MLTSENKTVSKQWFHCILCDVFLDADNVSPHLISREHLSVAQPDPSGTRRYVFEVQNIPEHGIPQNLIRSYDSHLLPQRRRPHPRFVDGSHFDGEMFSTSARGGVAFDRKSTSTQRSRFLRKSKSEGPSLHLLSARIIPLTGQSAPKSKDRIAHRFEEEKELEIPRFKERVSKEEKEASSPSIRSEEAEDAQIAIENSFLSTDEIKIRRAREESVDEDMEKFRAVNELEKMQFPPMLSKEAQDEQRAIENSFRSSNEEIKIRRAREESVDEEMERIRIAYELDQQEKMYAYKYDEADFVSDSEYDYGLEDVDDEIYEFVEDNPVESAPSAQ